MMMMRMMIQLNLEHKVQKILTPSAYNTYFNSLKELWRSLTNQTAGAQRQILEEHKKALHDTAHKANSKCEIWDSHRGVVEHSNLLQCGAVYVGEWFPAFSQDGYSAFISEGK